MIFPSKNLNIENSLLGIGGNILTHFPRENATTVTNLWDSIKESNANVSFEKFLLSLDFLFAIGAIYIKNGMIYKSFEVKNVN